MGDGRQRAHGGNRAHGEDRDHEDVERIRLGVFAILSLFHTRKKSCRYGASFITSLRFTQRARLSFDG
jgi:hypothetical protein